MMVLPDKKDAIHKAWLYRVLEAIADDGYLAGVLYFKGGTCASMLGWLDRFSVDLDFDYSGSIEDIPKTRKSMKSIFSKIGLSIKDKSKSGIQYFLKYNNSSEEGAIRTGRNTLKIEAAFPILHSSIYQTQRFLEIDRVLTCQTKETMFAHKLVAITDRFNKTGHIAGRDIYDIHHFFMQGYGYNAAVIKERTGVNPEDFLSNLATFIEQKVTETIITEDLSSLLPPKKFSLIRKVLKRETIGFIRDELIRLEK
jgi:predicted nucleotidyltransferase component of viral defense system